MTITGADDSVSPVELAAISRDFPFVEWGILFSQSRQGIEPRYPSARWLQTLDAIADRSPSVMNLSAHLCGQYVRDIFGGNGDVLLRASRKHSFWCYSRFQLNGFSNHFVDKAARIPEVFQHLRIAKDGTTIICQVGNPYANERAAALEMVFGNYAALYDTSGGEGIPMPSFDCLVPPPTPTISVGYAGGIGMHNVASVVRSCKEEWKDHDNTFWLDMETHVRSDDGKTFDLKRVVAVLEAVAPLLDFPPKDV